jgi:single-stranded DNA-binding protein
MKAEFRLAGKQYLRLNLRVSDGDVAQWVGMMAFDPEAIAIHDKFVKGARVYIEGTLRLDEWTDQNGAKRTGLSVMSWHCRLAAIGRNKPKSGRERAEASAYAPPPATDDFHNDPIPF